MNFEQWIPLLTFMDEPSLMKDEYGRIVSLRNKILGDMATSWIPGMSRNY